MVVGRGGRIERHTESLSTRFFRPEENLRSLVPPPSNDAPKQDGSERVEVTTEYHVNITEYIDSMSKKHSNTDLHPDAQTYLPIEDEIASISETLSKTSINNSKSSLEKDESERRRMKDTHFQNTIQYAENGRLREALSEISLAITCNSSDWYLHDVKAQILLGLEQEKEALRVVDEAIYLAPNSSGPCVTKGRILRNLGLPKDAYTWFQKVVNGSVHAKRETRLEAIDEMIEVESLIRRQASSKFREQKSKTENLLRQAAPHLFRNDFRFTGHTEWSNKEIQPPKSEAHWIPMNLTDPGPLGELPFVDLDD
ncbi:hypothetical protein AAMO2058_001207400 [Amorphochlora amoebiformis]